MGRTIIQSHDNKHCVKSVGIRSYSGPHFPRIWTEYEEILRISSYSGRMRENADQNNFEYGHFLHSEDFKSLCKFYDQ